MFPLQDQQRRTYQTPRLNSYRLTPPPTPTILPPTQQPADAFSRHARPISPYSKLMFNIASGTPSVAAAAVVLGRRGSITRNTHLLSKVLTYFIDCSFILAQDKSRNQCLDLILVKFKAFLILSTNFQDFASHCPPLTFPYKF